MFLGKKEFSKKILKGKFYCPECRRTTGFFLKQNKSFRVIFWFPVWPLGPSGRYVECQECKHSFRENVLDSDPATSRAEFHPSMKRIMVLMMLADGEIDDLEIEKIKEIYTRVSGYEVSVEELRKDVESSMQEGGRVSEYLKKVTPYLNKHGKEQVLKSAYYVATADGVFQNEEQVLLEEISAALEIEPDHYESVLSSLLKESEEINPIAGLTNVC